jgi:hypothetical protein
MSILSQMISTMCKIVSLSIPLVKSTFVDGTRHFKLYCKLMIFCSFSRYYGGIFIESLFTIRNIQPVASTNGLNRSADRSSHIFIKNHIDEHTDKDICPCDIIQFLLPYTIIGVENSKFSMKLLQNVFSFCL